MGMMLHWRRIRSGHYIAAGRSHTYEVALHPLAPQPCWVLVYRYWPGDGRQPGNIYDTSGLGHFPTLRVAKAHAERFEQSAEILYRSAE